MDDYLTPRIQLALSSIYQYDRQAGLVALENNILTSYQYRTTPEASGDLAIQDHLAATFQLLPLKDLPSWVTIKKIGSGKHGSVYLLADLFVAKIDLTSDHEAVIGYVINTLRAKIPNFVHTYGVFPCTEPIGEIFCLPKGDTVTYMVLENIVEAIPLSKKLLTDDEFLQVYLQVLSALNLAWKEFDFTHYDLNANNILVQELSEPISIPFGDSFLTTKYLARIIDFGLSHVKLPLMGGGTVSLGKYGYEHANIFADRSFPIYDAYKLLLDCYRYDQSKYDVVHAIYLSFDVDQTLEDRITSYYTEDDDFLQPPLSFQGYTLDHLINYILEVRDITFITTEPAAPFFQGDPSIEVAAQLLRDRLNLNPNLDDELMNILDRDNTLNITLADQQTPENYTANLYRLLEAINWLSHNIRWVNRVKATHNHDIMSRSLGVRINNAKQLIRIKELILIVSDLHRREVYPDPAISKLERMIMAQF